MSWLIDYSDKCNESKALFKKLTCTDLPFFLPGHFNIWEEVELWIMLLAPDFYCVQYWSVWMLRLTIGGGKCVPSTFWHVLNGLQNKWICFISKWSSTLTYSRLVLFTIGSPFNLKFNSLLFQAPWSSNTIIYNVLMNCSLYIIKLNVSLTSIAYGSCSYWINLIWFGSN